MAKDLHNEVKVVLALSPQTISTDTTTDGEAVDSQGFEGVEFAIASGTLTDGTYTPILEESDTGAFGGEETAVADADLLGTEAGAAFAATDDDTVTKLGYKGNKRYTRLTLVSASTSSGGLLAAVCVLSNPTQGVQTTQKI